VPASDIRFPFNPHAYSPVAAPASSEELVRREVLNLGCGHKRCAEAVNLDVTPATGPDVVHDLNRLPWPFPDDQFREVMAYDVLEHLDDLLAVMGEIHRICRDGAVIRITLPHYSCANAFTDPTHRHYFGCFSFDCFTDASPIAFYSRARFRLRDRKLWFYPSLVNKLVRRLANRYPAAYERRWAWIFPAWFLYFELEVVKERGTSPSA
jgi:SAM-dependent methyltransferase